TIQDLGLAEWPPRRDALAREVFGSATDTVDLYKQTGEWTPERKLLHDSIAPDRIKEMLPEYKQLRSAGDPYAASGVHEESSEIAKRIQQEAYDRGLSVLIDTTGSSSTFVGKLEAAQAAGYDVKVSMFSIPTNEAI